MQTRPAMPTSPHLPLALGGLVLAALAVSGVAPHDRATWLLEVAPVLIALPVMAATWRRFPLTPLLYGLIALHALVLILGGTYTYARVPLGFWLQDLLHSGAIPTTRSATSCKAWCRRWWRARFCCAAVMWPGRTPAWRTFSASASRWR